MASKGVQKYVMYIIKITEDNIDRVKTLYDYVKTIYMQSIDSKRLRTCKATVYQSCGDYVLKSYNTIVAAYVTADNGKKVFYDF